jgi:hypothetical protein
MSGLCRSTCLAVGSEEELSQMLAYTVTDETDFTAQYETGVLYKEPAAFRIEVISRSRPPLEQFVGLSRKLPSLRFAIEWEDPIERVCGCACIANGTGELVHLTGLIRRLEEDCGDSETARENAMLLKFEIMREVSSRLFGHGWRSARGPWDEEENPFRNAAQQYADDILGNRPDSTEAINWLKEGF